MQNVKTSVIVVNIFYIQLHFPTIIKYLQNCITIEYIKGTDGVKQNRPTRTVGSFLSSINGILKVKDLQGT